HDDAAGCAAGATGAAKDIQQGPVEMLLDVSPGSQRGALREVAVPEPIDDRSQGIPRPPANKEGIAVLTLVAQGTARCPELQPRSRCGSQVGAQPAMTHDVRAGRRR